MGAVLPPWPHAAAATETRVRISGEETIITTVKPSRSVRMHGKLILSHGTRRVGPRSSSVDVTRRVAVELDHRADNVRSAAAFTCVEACHNLIHGMLAEAPATSEYDLAAAGNWVDSTRTPLDIATSIVQYVQKKYDDDVPEGLEVDVHLPKLQVTLAYSEPKALLLACKDAAGAVTEAAGALARGRKRRREPAGEQCAICLLDVEIEQEDTVRLPCFHPFHHGCIGPWFHRASTCPTCRLDIMGCFSFVRSINGVAKQEDEQYRARLMMQNWFGDESEDEQSIAFELGLFNDEYESADQVYLDRLNIVISHYN